MHGPLQEKTRVWLIHASGKLLNENNYFHVSFRPATITWLFGLLEILVLHQLLPCVVIYRFAP